MLIDEQGKKVGIVTREEALAQAKEKGFDLELVAIRANPQVVRLINFGKEKYELEKAKRKARVKSKPKEDKEIRLSPNISEHDFSYKMKQAEKFLGKGHRVRSSIILKGREMAMPDKAISVLNHFNEELKDISELNESPKRMGRVIISIIKPK